MRLVFVISDDNENIILARSVNYKTNNPNIKAWKLDKLIAEALLKLDESNIH